MSRCPPTGMTCIRSGGFAPRSSTSTVRVSALEAIDGTPIIDVKPTLGPANER